MGEGGLYKPQDSKLGTIMLSF